jgi:hypothetical protein
MMAMKTLRILSAGALFALTENNAISKFAVHSFTVGERSGWCSTRRHEVHLLSSYLDSLSSGGSDDDAGENLGGPVPKSAISVNSYLDSLSKPKNEPTSYGDISYGQGGISPASWASKAATSGYLDNIGAAHGATPSPWDSGKSPSPWTPPATPAKFAPVPTDNQAKKDQGLLFFADVLSSQKNQQDPPRPTNANVQNRAIGDVPGWQGQPPPAQIGDPSQYLESIPKYKSLYEEIEEEVGIIRPPKKQESASQQQQQQAAYVPGPPPPSVPYKNPVPDPAEPIVSVEAPENPNKYNSVPQPGEVVTPAPSPAPRSSSGPPSWVVQATQETNSLPPPPIVEEQEQIPSPRFASDDQTNYASRANPPAPVPPQQTPSQPQPSRPQPQYQAPAPVKVEEPVALVSRPNQVVVNFKKGAPAVDDQQKEIDDAFLRLAGALATSTRYDFSVLFALLNHF